MKENQISLNAIVPAHEDGRLGEALGLPARSRFGEGRAEPLKMNHMA
jgi:hypothetical protein